VSKKAKKETKAPLLKEQDRIDVELKADSQDITNSEGFTDQEETLIAENRSEFWPYDAPQETLKMGDLVDNKYEIIALLGAGGMGAVFLARHKELGTQVALKVLHRHLINTTSAIERFKTEARAAHALNSKNLVSVLDYGVLSDGQPYLAMQCIDGVNLADYLKSKCSLSIGDTFLLVMQVAAGLEEAHSKGIVHRDIKPSNILIEGNLIKPGSIKVVDFGISKGLASDGSSQQLTHTGQIFGSPIYMSPEQCKGETVDFKTDLYSLGCVMFECLTGAPPFQGKNAIETLFMHCNEEPPTLGVQGKPPRGFTEAKTVLKKLLAKDPAQRLPNAAAVTQALEGIESSSSEPKIFSRTLVRKGDKRFKADLLRIGALLIGLLGIYMYLTYSNGTYVDAKSRLQELYRLGGAHNRAEEYRFNDEEHKNEDYLEKAVALAEKTFGKTSPQSAEAYTVLGMTSYKPRFDALEKAVEITDKLAANHSTAISTKELEALRQKYALNLASRLEPVDWARADQLYDKALSFGPIGSRWWNIYSLHLLDHQEFLKAARAFVAMKTAGKEPLPSIEELSKQKVNSVAGRFVATGEPFGRLRQTMELELSLHGKEVVGRFSLHAFTKQGLEVLTPVPFEQEFQGSFRNGILEGRGKAGRFIISRVGKHLVCIEGRLRQLPFPDGQTENLYEEK